jgi:hypothetical protein
MSSTINERLSETLARLELMDRVDDKNDDDENNLLGGRGGEGNFLFFGEDDDDDAEATMFSSAHDVDGCERESISSKNNVNAAGDGDGDDNDDDEKEDSSLPSCAICLNAPSLENSCFTVPCLHSFCAKCIVRWANFQEEEENAQRKKRGLSSTHHNHHHGQTSFAAKCPSCRVPFENLLCYRELDGSVHRLGGELDLREHPLCLLKRSKWLGLEETEEEMYGGRQSSFDDSFEEEYGHGYHGMKSSNKSAYYDIDDEYFAKRGGARVVIGNRRFGANGFVASGRALARPIQQPMKKEKMGSAAFSSSPNNQHSMMKMKGSSPTTKMMSASPPTTVKGTPPLGTTPPSSSSASAPKGKKSMKKQLQNEKKRQKDQEKAARRLATRKEYQRKVPIEDSQPRMAEQFATDEEVEEGEQSIREEASEPKPAMTSVPVAAEIIM